MHMQSKQLKSLLDSDACSISPGPDNNKLLAKELKDKKRK